MERPDTLTYLKNKYSLDFSQKMPIKLPLDRFRGFCGLLNELGYKTGAEIGVLKGLYSKWLCSKNRKLKLYCVDPYKSYKEYSEYLDQTQMDALCEEAHRRLAEFNCEFVKKFSMDAVKDFNDESLDFVYIDANHAYQFVLDDIREWSKKVKKGGIISGHDYSEFHQEVRKAVDDWVRDNKISPYFVTERDKTWFYVK